MERKGIDDSVMADGQRIEAARKAADSRKKFESSFPFLVDELCAYLESVRIPQEGIDWYRRVKGPRI